MLLLFATLAGPYLPKDSSKFCYILALVSFYAHFESFVVSCTFSSSTCFMSLRQAGLDLVHCCLWVPKLNTAVHFSVRLGLYDKYE